MLPEGYILRLIRKYNSRLLYWDAVLIALCVFPAFHQSGKPDYIANWDYLALSVFIMIALNNLAKFLIWNSKPVLHPVCKFLRRYGDPEEIIGTIDKDAEKEGADTIFPVKAAGGWLVLQRLFRISLIPLSEVVWVYEKASGSKGGKTSLVIFTSDKKPHIIKFRLVANRKNPSADISSKTPWAFSGYSEKKAYRWKNKRQEMIDAAMASYKKANPCNKETNG